MYIYIIMVTISLFNAYAFRKKKKLAIAMSLLPFFVVSAIRFDVGTDYMYRYVPDYYSIYNGKDVTSLEILFKLFYRICIFFVGNRYQIVFIITSFVINGLIFWVIYKYSKNVYLSILLYFITGYFFQSMNVVRQYVDMAILLAGHQLVVEKKYMKWSILCIFAVFIHTSSLICFLLIFINQIKEINLKVLIGFVISYLLFEKTINGAVAKIIYMTRFGGYYDTKFGGQSISVIQIVTNLVLYLFMWYSYMIKKGNDEVEDRDRLFLNIQATAIIVTILGNIIMLFSRMTYYFQIFQLVSIPNFLAAYKNKLNKKIITILIIALFAALFIRSNILNNYNEVLPYKTFLFNKVRGEIHFYEKS